MWLTIIKYSCIVIYTPSLFQLISDISKEIKIPDLQLEKRVKRQVNDVTSYCSYCKCGVCEQNRKQGLPINH